MKKYLRSLAIVYSFAFFGIGSFILGNVIFCWIRLTCKDSGVRLEKYSDCIFFTWKFFISMVERLKIFKVNVKDIERIRGIKNSVIVASHPSFVDVVILMSIIPRTTCYVAEKLTRNPMMKNVVGAFFLPAGQPLGVFEKDAKAILDKGYNILIFPTGTRHKRNEHPKVRKGASLIAIDSKRDIYPVKVTTSEDFLQTNQPFYKAGNEVVQYDIELKEVIKTNDYIEKYDDEVTLKKELSKRISEELFGE